MYNFSITIIQPPMGFALSFKDEGLMKTEREKVHAAIKAYFMNKQDTMLTLKDDYDNRLDVLASNISTVLMQNNESNNDRNNDNNIDVARSNAKFLERRNGDMELMRLFPGSNLAHPAVGRA